MAWIATAYDKQCRCVVVKHLELDKRCDPGISKTHNASGEARPPTEKGRLSNLGHIAPPSNIQHAHFSTVWHGFLIGCACGRVQLLAVLSICVLCHWLVCFGVCAVSPVPHYTSMLRLLMKMVSHVAGVTINTIQGRTGKRDRRRKRKRERER